ncbi:MAG: DUF1540 domain-containing protein [Bacilli bacterium]|nr:DUF1540 domain-containing protein [Bacilli bacterium]
MNQKISCTVYDCKFNSPFNDKCTLKRIIVMCCKGNNEKETTMCAKYVKTKLD